MYGRPSWSRLTGLKLRSQRPAVFRFLVGLAEQLRFKHLEVVGHGQAHFILGPVLAGLRLLLLVALLDDREAELSQDEVCLSWCLAAAELVGRQYAAN